MGNIRAMARTDQLEGASVYEPIFSPDGRWVWFLNAGSLYEIRVHPVRAARRSAARLVAKIGFLDLGSTGLSKAGMGAREMAWDPVHKRLWYRIGRFWGESVSWLGYITRRAGKWGTPTDSWPSFAAEIESAWPNIQDCAVDHRGLLWVWYYSTPHGHWVWASYDGTRSLAPGAGRPSFCRAIARPAPQVIRSRRART
jgi:hypothetical protein